MDPIFLPPGFIIMQLLSVAVPIGGVAFFGWLGLRYVRARERAADTTLPPVRADELERLNDAMLSLQSEVHALRERQEFVEKLLERPRQDPGSPG